MRGEEFSVAFPAAVTAVASILSLASSRERETRENRNYVMEGIRF